MLKKASTINIYVTLYLENTPTIAQLVLELPKSYEQSRTKYLAFAIPRIKGFSVATSNPFQSDLVRGC